MSMFSPIQEKMMDHDLLTIEEEEALGKRILAGDKEAVELLIKKNYRLVIAVAKNYWFDNAKDDVIEDGNLGLIYAARRFDYRKGRFASYAQFYIRNEIQRGLVYNTAPVKIPYSTLFNYKGIKAAADKIRPDASAEEITSKCGRPRFSVDGFLIMKRGHVSLETPSKEGAFIDLKALVPDHGETPEDKASKSMIARTVARLSSNLSTRNKDILFRRFGIGYEDQQTLSYIGSQYGISKERTRQIINESLEIARFTAKSEWRRANAL